MTSSRARALAAEIVSQGDRLWKNLPPDVQPDGDERLAVSMQNGCLIVRRAGGEELALIAGSTVRLRPADGGQWVEVWQDGKIIRRRFRGPYAGS